VAAGPVKRAAEAGDGGFDFGVMFQVAFFVDAEFARSVKFGEATEDKSAEVDRDRESIFVFACASSAVMIFLVRSFFFPFFFFLKEELENVYGIPESTCFPCSGCGPTSWFVPVMVVSQYASDQS